MVVVRLGDVVKDENDMLLVVRHETGAYELGAKTLRCVSPAPSTNEN